MAIMLKFLIFTCGLLIQNSVGQALSELQISPPKNTKTIAEGKRLLLTCSYQIANVQNVTWIGPEGNVLKSNKDIDMTVVSETTTNNMTNVYLTYMSVTKEQSGMYACEGLLMQTTNETKVRVTIEVDVFIPVKIVNTESKQTLKLEDDGVINCEVVGEPKPTVTWKKDGELLVVDNDKLALEHETSNLIVRRVSLDDEGVYECLARETSQGQTDLINIDVSVMVKPVITSLKTSMVPVVGVDFEIICLADGKPAPKYKFFKYDDELFDYVALNTTEAGNVVIIRDVTKADTEGDYTCDATNDAGTTSETLRVIVYEAPTINSTSGAVAEASEPAVLTCIGAGDPVPEVVFMRYGIPLNISTEQYVIASDGTSATLTFLETTLDDSGLYVCRASSMAGSVEQEIQLDIQYAPKDTEIRPVYACPNSEATLECQFEANPVAELKWGVYIENAFVAVNESDVEYADGIAYLQISTSSDEAYRTYTCQAENAIGVNTADATVFKATEPNAPTNLQVSTTNTKDFSFTFDGPVENNVEILNYVLEIKPTPSSGTSMQSISQQVRKHSLSNLQPNTTYTVTLQTQNCIGVGPKSEPLSVTTKAIGKPEPVSVVSGKTAVEHDQYTVQWRLNSAAGGSIQKVVINVKKVTSEIDGDVTSEVVQEFVILKDDQEFEDERFTLFDLDPSSKYEVTLVAHNEVGSSENKFEFMTNIQNVTSASPTTTVAAAAVVITTAAPVVESTTMADVDQKISGGGSGLIIGLIVLVLVVLLIIVDCLCCWRRDWGVTMWIYMHTCGKGKSKSKDIESGTAGDKASNLTPISENPANETAPLKGQDNAVVADDDKPKEETKEEKKTSSTPVKEEEKSLIENSKPEEENNAAA